MPVYPDALRMRRHPDGMRRPVSETPTSAFTAINPLYRDVILLRVVPLHVHTAAKKFGVASTEDACEVALKTGTTEYQFVRKYLEHRPPLLLNLRQVDPLIRQLTLYRDLIQARTEDNKENQSESD